MEHTVHTLQKLRIVQYRPARSNAKFATGGGRGNHNTGTPISKEM